MRKRSPRSYQLEHYVKKHFSLYIFTIILFVMGVVFGSLIIHTLSLVQKEEMVSYLSQFFHGISDNGEKWLTAQTTVQQVVFENIKYILLIWFLGLSIIGVPIIFLLLFMKGFVIGFTVSFLVSQLEWKGFLFSVVSIVPQNLIIVPTFIVAAVAGAVFSVSLIKSRIKQQHNNEFPSFTSYSILMAVLAGILVAASGFEAYISPYLMKTAASFLIQ